ncbi:protein kinase [Streptomyces sp. RFCAC02]|uniref:protein kinase domain-containing protein n=1 Tax=Streptomyces sp. RFCAC02 TaxID=2499143 RepID=UPI00101FD8DC|nr:protein kinase [Streptomyces sp. RFCAC02]
MAQDQGAAGSGEDESGASGNEVPETPDMWGNGGFVGDGRYRLTHRLGRGGMAEVFAAEDVRLGRTVAVKLLRSDLAEDPVSKARFTREAQSVAGLNHHAVVAVFDSGEETGNGRVTPYIVMELVNGRTIRDLLIDSDPPPPERALAIVSGVLEALAYSHQHGIVHRDIKPANVIITDTGAVKVMDFGIARALHGAAQTMTQTGMVMGTPQYLSPEQALGKTVDTRSDLYAVGCLLYELLTLRPPFIGETPLSVVYQHVQDMPRLPSEVAPASPPELDGLVMRALTKDPEDRYQTAEEMRGMVRYALRMLEEHGGHTAGLWNTGSLTGGTTPPLGTAAPTRATTTAATPAAGVPLLLGGPDGTPPGGTAADARTGSRLRILLVAVLAVLAVATGVLVAVRLGGGDDPADPPAESGPPSPTESADQRPDDESPSSDETAEEDEHRDDSGTSGGQEWDEDWDQGWEDDGDQSTTSPTEQPTGEETEQPTGDPTQSDDETPPPDSGSDDGGSGDEGEESPPPTGDTGTGDAEGGDADTGTGEDVSGAEGDTTTTP